MNKEDIEKKESELLENDNKIEVKPYETFKLHELANMFPFNITPALIESKIAHAIAAKQRMFNTLTPQMAFMIITLLIAAAIAAVILYKFMGGGAPEVIVKLDPGLQMIKGNLTG